MAASSRSKPSSDDPVMMAHARANGSTDAESPSSAERSSKLPLLPLVGRHRDDDEPDRRIELRREGLVRSGQRRLDASHDVLGDFLLEALLVGGRRLGLRRGRGGRSPALRAQLVDQDVLLLYSLLELLELLLHR